MKISSASKKVLASALSAAMVVAFAPTVAFGAQDGSKVTVNYSVGSGVSQSGGSQSTISSTQQLVVDSGDVTLQDGTDLGLKSGDEYYSFKEWSVAADIDKDGKIDLDSTGHKDKSVTVNNNKATVSDVEIDSSTPLYATATYDTAKISSNDPTFAQATGRVTFNDTVSAGTIKGTGKLYVTAPDGTKSDAIGTSGLSEKSFAAQAGEWKVSLVDGNGVELDSKSYFVGSLTLTGGAFADWAVSEKYNTSQTVWYVASSNQKASAILTAAGATCTTAYKIKADGTVNKSDEGTLYTADGTAADALDIKAGAKGAVNTVLTASYASDEVKIQNFAAAKASGTLSLLIAGTVAANSLTASDVKEPSKANNGGYYVALADASGKVVRESVNGVSTGATYVSLSKTMSFDGLSAGEYTVTLYKVTAATAAGDTTDGVPGKIETVGSAKATVADDYAAAPTWTYTAKYKADGSADGGTLTLANAAGDGYKVLYSTTGAADPATEYDTAKGGLTVAAQTGSTTYTLKASNTSAPSKKASKVVTLVGYHDALNSFGTAASGFATKAVNGKVGTYYADDAGVKAAVAAAKKTFTDTGFVEQAKSGDSAVKTWASVTIAAEQSVVDAVAGVAKAELAKYQAGVASADGKSVSLLSAEDYAAAVKSVEAVSAAYAVNHDGDSSNNVANASGVTLGDLGTYVNAVDEALKAGAAKATTYKADDVKAAADVTAALKAATDGTAAQAAIDAYQKLTDTQKKLVDTSALAAAHKVVDDQAKKDAEEAAKKAAEELVKAQDKAAVAGITGKTVKAKSKKKVTAKLAGAVSESGAVVTFSKKSGNAKVKVGAAGKITVKKGLKKGKKYTVKVTATCGSATKVVKVVVKVVK